METITQDRSLRSRKDRPVPTLRVLFARGKPVERAPIVLTEGTTMLGRKPSARVKLGFPDDKLQSRNHAAIHYRRGKLEIADQESRNGTAVNGAAVTRTELADGDLIRIGDTLILVRYVVPGAPDPDVPELVGSSPAMARLRSTLVMVAPTDATIVLIGESGVGKNQSVKALHRLSDRAASELVAINCAAIPATLAESTLFGHRAGAFTGARTNEPGYFRTADGGTLFVDEIGDLPLELQPKLLHAIEDRTVVPVGSTTPITVDVRIVAATSVDLMEAVRSRRFRGDLYARLAEIVIELPPLRDRREDILPLLRVFLGPAPPLSADLAEALVLRDWPFNVRELKNVATELRVRGAGRAELDVDLVADRFQRPDHPPAETRSPSEPDRGQAPQTREELEALLAAHGGVVAAVARATGRSRQQVYRWFDKFGLER